MGRYGSNGTPGEALACASRSESGPVALAEVAPPTLAERTLPHTRAWFAGFVVWMIGWALVALLAFRASEQGDPWALRLWVLGLMCFYLSLCNSLLPLPTAWIILLAAAPDFALVQAGWLRVLVVAGLATLATVVANVNEYHLLAYLFRFGLGRRIRGTRVYGWAVRWFDRASFQVLTLIAFVPVPIDAIRWLAILRGYSRPRFALAYLLGRGPRYLIFAWCSVLLHLSGGQIAAIQLVMVAAALAVRLAARLVTGAGRAHPARSPGVQRSFPAARPGDRAEETASAAAGPTGT